MSSTPNIDVVTAGLLSLSPELLLNISDRLVIRAQSRLSRHLAFVLQRDLFKRGARGDTYRKGLGHPIAHDLWDEHPIAYAVDRRDERQRSFADDGWKTTGVAIVSRALQFGVPDTINTSFDRHTPLTLAVLWNNRLITKYLISMGANVNCETPDTPVTPLRYALNNAMACNPISSPERELPIIVALLNAGANALFKVPKLGWGSSLFDIANHSKSDLVLTKLVPRLFDIHVGRGERLVAASDLRCLLAALSQPQWAQCGLDFGDYASLVYAALEREELRETLAAQHAKGPQVVRKGLFS